LVKISIVFISLIVALVCCTKKEGKNPSLAYTDYALLDSCQQPYHFYYKNDPTTLLSGAHGPHGTFKLRFNATAFKALTDGGKLPVGASFPEGSLIIKDIYQGSDLTLYAFMYKTSGSWLWGEIKPNRTVLYGVKGNPTVCNGCHSQSGNRDLAVSFNFY